MGKPVKNLFGSLFLENIQKAVKNVPSILDNYKGSKNIKVKAAQWDNGGVTLSVWNPETKENIAIGTFYVSKFDTDTSAVDFISEVELPAEQEETLEQMASDVETANE